MILKLPGNLCTVRDIFHLQCVSDSTIENKSKMFRILAVTPFSFMGKECSILIIGRKNKTIQLLKELVKLTIINSSYSGTLEFLQNCSVILFIKNVQKIMETVIVVFLQYFNQTLTLISSPFSLCYFVMINDINCSFFKQEITDTQRLQFSTQI